MMQIIGITPQGRLTGAALGSILAAAGLFAAATPGYATTVAHDGSAYGAEVKVGSVVKLGKIALAQFPSCSAQATGSFTATVASTGENGLFSAGVVDDNAASTATSSTSTSEVAGADLLGGIISTGTLKSVSTSSVSSAGVPQFSSAGTNFASLKVLGIPIAANVAPNTGIDLPGIGSVILNEQATTLTGDEAKLEVTAIDVIISVSNLFGYAVGTEIKIADASSEVRVVKGPALVGGYAESPELVVGSITSGPLVDQLVPCQGSYGATETDQVAAANITGVVTTGAVTASETSNANTSETSVTTTTQIAGINLLGGLVSASAITGTATATTSTGEAFDFTGGSTFVGISVAGHPEITDTIKPNTTISLAGLGTLYLNKLVKSTDYVKAVPIELVVDTENSLGLPIGAEVTLGVSRSELHSAAIP
jgi:hypothetical protein